MPMARMRHCNRAPCKSLVNTTEECNGGGEQGDGPSLVLLYNANENHKKIQNLITVCMKQSKLLLSEIS